VPTETAERARIAKEKRLARYARYDSSEKGRARHARYQEKKRPEVRKLAKQNKPFIVWDGEQPRDTGYSLFGNSEGMEICHPHLSTRECLELIVDAEMEFPDAIHVGFGFNLDVSWILKDLPWRALNRLKKYGRCMWNGYQLEHIPHKWFAVKYGTVNAKIFDIHSFFAGKLTDALEDWRIGPWNTVDTTISVSQTDPVSLPSVTQIKKMTEKQIVAIFKKMRGDFLWKDIQSIAVYMRLELKYTKLLMEALREAFLAAGYLPDSWHGPGALATMAMKRHNVYKSMDKCPAQVREAARYAFFGGRFSQYLCGHIRQKVYFADRNSAYPYACLSLPNLAKGSWRFVTAPSEIRESLRAGQFALYRIAYHDRTVKWVDDWTPVTTEATRRMPYKIYPLPKRSKNGGIEFAPRVTGWYWTPEAQLVMDDKAAEIRGAWVFDEDDCNDRPFAWIAEYYRRRQMLKRNGSAAEKTFKLIINAVFGQCARRQGWDKKNGLPPRSHQLEWAGYITSHCRAALYKVAIATGEENVISIDTDGLLSLNPIPIEHDGDGLGEWKTDIYDEAIVWQSGMYALRKDGKWDKAKTRGIARAAYSPDDLIDAVCKGTTVLKLKQNKFLGYGLALNGQFDKNNTWIEDDFDFHLGGNGSRYHDVKHCQRDCWGDIHRVKLKTFLFLRMDEEAESSPHYLPWEDNTEDMLRRVELFDDLTLFDSWNPEEWSANAEEMAPELARRD